MKLLPVAGLYCCCEIEQREHEQVTSVRRISDIRFDVRFHGSDGWGGGAGDSRAAARCGVEQGQGRTNGGVRRRLLLGNPSGVSTRKGSSERNLGIRGRLAADCAI